MESAQEIFKAWAKSDLAPALRALGFKGSGQTFAIPDDDCWVLVGVQKSTGNSSSEVSFTFNLSVANRLLWSELREWEAYWLPSRPSATATYPPGQTWSRIGGLMPVRQDHWWSIQTEASPHELAALTAETSAAIRDYGLPELSRLIEENSTARMQDRLSAIRRVRPRSAHLK